MDEAKRTREYIKHIVSIAKDLTRGISKKHEYRKFIIRNVEREWKKFRTGEKTLEQIQRNVVDIFYTVFPEYRMSKFIPSFSEFFSEKDETSKNHIELGVTHDDGDIQRAVQNEESQDARIQSRKRSWANRRRANVSEEDIMRDTTTKQKHFSVDDNENDEGPVKRRKLHDTDFVEENERNDKQLFDVEDNTQSNADYESEVQGTLKESLLKDIIRRAVCANELIDFDEDVLVFIEKAARIRLKNILKHLKKFSNMRQRNQELYSKKPEGNRVTTLLKIDRDVEEARLLRLRHERLALRRSTRNTSAKTKRFAKESVQSEAEKMNPANDVKIRKKRERLKQEKLEIIHQDRTAHLQRFVERKRKQRRNKLRSTGLSRLSELSDIKFLQSDAKDATKEFEKENVSGHMDVNMKLLRLPGLVTPHQLCQKENLESGTNMIKASFYSQRSITLFDCDLLMEFDPQLRKSDLRLKWISRVFDVPRIITFHANMIPIRPTIEIVSVAAKPCPLCDLDLDPQADCILVPTALAYHTHRTRRR
ncbi:hypothetical protein FGB62_154g18 [Gracilaria domingensis]|nr:hypothetical protein FGB62_154g18 [Gracilaria domingensis]